MPQLTQEEKNKLKFKLLKTDEGTKRSTLEAYLAEEPTAGAYTPGRFGDKPGFEINREDSEKLANLFQGGQPPYFPDGAWVKYIKNEVSARIDIGEIENDKQASTFMRSEFEKFRIDVQERVAKGEPISAVIQKKEYALENHEINNLKKSIEQLLQLNKTFFKPTGIKEMLNEIKKFEKIKSPTDEDRAELILKVQKIAKARLGKDNERSGLLQDFYQKTAVCENYYANPISKTSLENSKTMHHALQKVLPILEHSDDKKGIYKEINKSLQNNKNQTVEVKLASILQILENQLKEKPPLPPKTYPVDGKPQKAKESQEYKEYKEYIALRDYIKEAQQGKNPALDTRLSNTLDVIRHKNVVSALEASGLVEKSEPKERSPTKMTPM